MQEILANVDHIKFDLEIAVEQQLGAQPLPFPGMDSECWDASLYLAVTVGLWCLWLCLFQLRVNPEMFVSAESGSAVCEFFMRAACLKGKNTTFHNCGDLRSVPRCAVHGVVNQSNIIDTDCYYCYCYYSIINLTAELF